MDRVLQALADPTRRQILDLLAQEEKSAGEIAAHFPDMSRPAVSQHLSVLREAGLVHQERKGRLQLYRLEPNPLRELWEGWFAKYQVFWQDRLFSLKRAVEEDKRKNVDNNRNED